MEVKKYFEIEEKIKRKVMGNKGLIKIGKMLYNRGRERKRRRKDMLTTENLSFGVQEEKEIIRDLSLSVGEHKFVVITGPNGGGKSTLAKLTAGIEVPLAGRIYFEGRYYRQGHNRESQYGHQLCFSAAGTL